MWIIAKIQVSILEKSLLLCLSFWQLSFIELFNASLQCEFIQTFLIRKSHDCLHVKEKVMKEEN